MFRNKSPAISHGRAVYRTLPRGVASELAYVPDQMIFDFLLIKVKYILFGGLECIETPVADC